MSEEQQKTILPHVDEDHCQLEGTLYNLLTQKIFIFPQPHTQLLVQQLVSKNLNNSKGLVEHSFMFPVDLVKTRLQAQSQPNYLGVGNAFKSILKNEGFLGMYKGMSVVLVSAVPSHSLYFFVYEKTKRILTKKNQSTKRPSDFVTGVAGGFATCAHDLFSTPLDVIKQRMQVYNSPYHNMFSTMKTIYKQIGIKGLFSSFPVTLLMNIPYTVIHFITYENCKRILHKDDHNEKIWKHLLSGATAGAIGGLVSNPFDVIRTRVQTQEISHFKGLKEVTKSLYAENGWKSFTRGMTARMLYFTPSAAITWATYEYIKKGFHLYHHQKNDK